MNLAILDAYGIDSAEGVARCLGDAELYEGVLGMFLSDDAFARAKAAYDSGDMTALFRCAHELKGACGNVAMTELFGAVHPLVELLRGGTYAQAEVDHLFYRMEAAYHRAYEGVTKAMAG